MIQAADQAGSPRACVWGAGGVRPLRARVRPWLVRAGTLALGVALVSVALPARAAEPDLTDLVLHWIRGDFRSPLVCEFDGVPRRGLRRVLVTRGAGASLARRSVRIVFFDLEAGDASRCFDALGAPEPNLEGTLLVSLDAPSRPDTARRDFTAALRREGGFTLRIERGSLRVTPISAEGAAPELVDFAGGRAIVRRVEPGTDLARLLADLGGRRALELRLEAPDGTHFDVPLVERPPVPR